MKGVTCDFLPFQVIKHIWKEEVEERPQFRQVILQGGSCQQQFVVSWQHLQLLHQPTVQVFNPVALIHNQIVPVETLRRQT